MKNDPFENQLRGQLLRPPPANWRKDILTAAATQAGHASPASPQPASSWWRTLLWPAPHAWAGLAAMWVLIIGLQFSSDEKPAVPQKAQASPPRQVEYAMREKQRVFAELMSQMDTDVAVEPPKKFVPRPRSEGRPTVVFV
jgi:hypothetical protein